MEGNVPRKIGIGPEPTDIEISVISSYVARAPCKVIHIYKCNNKKLPHRAYNKVQCITALEGSRFPICYNRTPLLIAGLIP